MKMEQDISSLDLPNNTIRQFKCLGICYCSDVTPEDLKDKLTEREWKHLTTPAKIQTALDFYTEEIEIGHIPFLVPNLDDILGGGVQIGQITEFCGEPGSGKTQICLKLSVNVQLPAWCGGMNGEVFYIYTSYSFPSHRLKEMAINAYKSYVILKSSEKLETIFNDEEYTVDCILKKITCLKVNDIAELIAAIKYLETWTEQHKLRLVIIDSITMPIKQIFEFDKRKCLIHALFSDIQKLATEKKFAVILTNDMTNKKNSSNMFYIAPSLSESYYHRINTRIVLFKNELKSVKAKIEKNIFVKEKNVEYLIPI